MARQIPKVKKFNLEDSPIVAENERILEGANATVEKKAEEVEVPVITAGATQEKKATDAASTIQDPVSTEIARPIRKPKTQKTENGITVYVPMSYYERITIMKMRTGIPIKDLALQAIIEFVDRHKMD